MIQDIQQQSVSQVYPIGLPLVKDIRKFRYSQANKALVGTTWLRINANFAPGCTGKENLDGFEGAGGVNCFAASQGQKYLDIKDTAFRVRNFYQGGMVIVYGTLIYHQHYIVKSDPGDGTKVRLYLDVPIAVEDITTAMGVTAYKSQYSKTTPVAPAGGPAAGFAKFVGVNLIPVTINYFYWLQTKGPCAVTPTGGTWPGSAVNLRDIYGNPNDGSINPATLDDPSAGYQRCGTLISATVNTYGDLLIDLDLDPD